MKRLFPCLAGLVLLFDGLGQAVMFLPLGVSIASAATYDLAADWSDAANPHGVWTYREGTNALPSVADFTPLNCSVIQPAWAPSADSGNFLPVWFKSRCNNPEGTDILTGDVAVHSTDSGNGGSSGIANVIWTSPINGVIDISGAVWLARDIDRSNTWSLLLNGMSLTSGNLFSGDSFDRTNPFNFANGTGGSGALTSIAVSIGDVIELRIEKTSEDGDFVGVNLTITTITEDSDEDGVPDDQDECPDSDLSATVVIDDCNSGVTNTVFPSGCKISDLIAACAEGASNHGQFVSCVSHVTNDLKKAGIITGQQKGAIQSCAAQADIP